MICLKIRTFVVSATTRDNWLRCEIQLWFAWKFVPLWYQQQPFGYVPTYSKVVICLKIRTFVVSATTLPSIRSDILQLWFAWKFVPLWYQQQLGCYLHTRCCRCDLLENSYLCGISNNFAHQVTHSVFVVIYLKIRTFVVSATTLCSYFQLLVRLWFAWKFVPLWYQQQR